MNARVAFLGAFLAFMLLAGSPLSGQGLAESDLLKQRPLFSNTPHFNMQFGSMFSSGLQGGSMFTHSLAPSINWDISKRFSLQAGTIFSSTTMHGMNPMFPFTPHMAGGEAMSSLGNQRMFNTMFYAFGAYQVSPRLTLTGGTWMERSNMEMPQMQMNPQAFDTNPRGMMFGFDYRVTENFSFGAEVNVSRGYNPLNPFHNQGYYDPLFGGPRSPFHGPTPFHRNPRW